MDKYGIKIAKPFYHLLTTIFYIIQPYIAFYTKNKAP